MIVLMYIGENFMIDFFKNINYLFNNDEKMMLNHIAEGVGRDSCIEQLSFSMEVSDDQNCISVLQSVREKIRNLSDEEFADLQKYLPFNVPISDDDFELDEDELRVSITA